MKKLITALFVVISLQTIAQEEENTDLVQMQIGVGINQHAQFMGQLNVVYKPESRFVAQYLQQLYISRNSSRPFGNAGILGLQAGMSFGRFNVMAGPAYTMRSSDEKQYNFFTASLSVECRIKGRLYLLINGAHPVKPDAYNFNQLSVVIGAR